MNGSDTQTPAFRRYAVDDLLPGCARLLEAAGARQDIAAVVAETLVEGDLLGHDTHGLALLAPYVNELCEGRMLGDGEWSVESRSLAAELWNGNLLPGPWLVRKAIEVAAAKARSCGTGMVSVGASHHIACLAAYLRAPALDGLVTLIQSSDPAAAGIAPFGGTRAVISPNPLAAGLPTSGEPVMIDISTSITTFGLSRRLANQGKPLPGRWLLDAGGVPTDDPQVLFRDPPGTLLPLGGTDSGHKGFSLGLLVDALTGALSGKGRLAKPTHWSAAFTVQVIDPEAFCGLAAFRAEMDHLVAIARDNPPVDEANPVRLPGERGLARRAQALRDGLALPPAIAGALDALGARFGLDPIPTLPA